MYKSGSQQDEYFDFSVGAREYAIIGRYGGDTTEFGTHWKQPIYGSNSMNLILIPNAGFKMMGDKNTIQIMSDGNSRLLEYKEDFATTYLNNFLEATESFFNPPRSEN